MPDRRNPASAGFLVIGRPSRCMVPDAPPGPSYPDGQNGMSNDMA